MSGKTALCATTLRRSVMFGITAAGLFAYSLHPSAATGWTVETDGAQSFHMSSNPLLATTGATALWGSTTTPELIVQNTTPTAQLKLDTRVDENLFDQTAFNSTDSITTANVSTHNHLWTVGAQTNTAYDTTRTSELGTYGLTPVIARHLGLSIAPQVTFTPTAKDQWSLTGTAAQSTYDNRVFTDYATFSATPTYTRHIDPQNSALLSLTAQRYQATQGSGIRDDSMGPSVGWQTAFTPRLSANASIGAQTSRQYVSGTPQTPWTWQYIFGSAVAFKGITDTLNLNATRAQYPYGNGTEALQTSFSASESHALTPRFALTLGANYLSSTYQVNAPGNLADLTGGNAGMTYHATETLDLTTSYTYRYETLTGEQKTAQDHAVMLSLSYHPTAWAIVP